MSITRLSEFRAQAGKIGELRAFLQSIVPGIVSSDGCLSCQLLQGHDNSARFLMVEVWESIEAHQASLKNVAPEAFARVMELLDGSPRGGYFDTLT